MKTKSKFPITWFQGNLLVGLAIIVFSIGAMIYEFVQNDAFNVQSLNQHFGFGLLLIYFSGKPMADERIRFLKYKGLTVGFVVAFILVTVTNYLITYPDRYQENAISSYLFAVICLCLSFVCFFILKAKE